MAIPVSVAAAFLLINSHYGYWPTLGDLLGHPLPGQVSTATVQRELASAGRDVASAPPWATPTGGARAVGLGRARRAP